MTLRSIRWRPPATFTISIPHSQCSHIPHRLHTRHLSIQSRTYDDALRLLTTLQPNTSATNLFNAPTTPSAKSPSSRSSLNALAIPEMKEWLSRAGYSTDDLKRLRCVHVSGTKGKGSTCAYTAALLRRAFSDPTISGPNHLRERRRVGMYTSPHLVSVRERIEIDGEKIPRDVFTRRFFEVWDRFGDLANKDGGLEGVARPFYFRFLTILAFHVFLSEGVRDVVLECGIGGEYDATNVLPPEALSAAVVTHLGVDHVAMLGETVEEIAWHKAGIFKEGRVAFTRTQGPGVMEVLRRRASEKGARLVEVTDEDVRVGPWNDGEEGIGAGSGMEGAYQRDNRALAVMAAMWHLKGECDLAAVRKEAWIPGALGEARLKGRGQVLRRGQTTWYLDGAHTEESIRLAGSWFASRTGAAAEAKKKRRRVLVFNQQDRDAKALLETLVEASGVSGEFDVAVFTRNEIDVEPAEGGTSLDMSVQRGLEATMRRVSPATKTAVFGSLGEALREVGRYVSSVDGDGVDVLVTGSLYLVGGVLKVIDSDGQA